jgi:regulation of enolase protein 1 (concanavalin A-like superfamily)
MNSEYRVALRSIVLAILLPLSLAATASAGDELPPPWQGTDVGAVGVPGSANQGPNGDLFINGAGSDIWGEADSFHFVYQPFLDGEIGSNPPSLENTNQFAKIGLMIRESLEPGSPHVILDIKPDNSVEFMTRSTSNGETRFIAGTGPSSHSWVLQLVRRSGLITARICELFTCQTIGSAPFPSSTAFAGAVITSHDASTVNHGVFPASMPYVLHLPQPWQDYDIGDVGIPGRTVFQDDTFVVQAAGADIWGTSDSYHLVANYMKGNGEILARVKSESASHPFAKAGVIMTGLDGRVVVLDIRPDGPVEFMARSSSGAEMQFIAGASSPFPVWLKLERTADLFTGSMSHDGRNWEVVGTTTFSVPEVITAGLAVTSHDTTSINTSLFDRVLDASQVPLAVDIGEVGIAGVAATETNSTAFTVQGGGADIWGTDDAFTYYYQFLKDDGQMIVKVNSLEDTAPFAKAGVMIRDGIDASSPHVLLDVTPSGLLELLTRESAGTETRWIGGRSPSPFPIWLKLARSGTTITASASQDGSTWQPVGTAFTQLPSAALIGVAVTSHQKGVVTSATFDNLSR